jgi:hypothetical protein
MSTQYQQDKSPTRLQGSESRFVKAMVNCGLFSKTTPKNQVFFPQMQQVFTQERAQPIDTK